MTTPLSITLKLDRAQEHILALDDEIGRYLDSEPYKIVRNVQPSDPRLVLFEFHVIHQPEPHLGTILGDCLHNLRSALDHLACRLVEENNGTVCKGARGTHFPISNEERWGKRGNQLLPQIAGGVAPDVLTIIDALQPYTRGQDASRHPLSILNELSNADKHRMLHVAVAHVSNPNCRLILPDGTILAPESCIRVAHHETPIAAFKFPESFTVSLYGNIEVEAGGDTFVSLQEPSSINDRPITLLLNDIRTFIIDNVIFQLSPFIQ